MNIIQLGFFRQNPNKNPVFEKIKMVPEREEFKTKLNCKDILITTKTSGGKEFIFISDAASQKTGDRNTVTFLDPHSKENSLFGDLLIAAKAENGEIAELTEDDFCWLREGIKRYAFGNNETGHIFRYILKK